jgi:hypothetical protein
MSRRVSFSVRAAGGSLARASEAAEKAPHAFCHSERSEESLLLFMGLNRGGIPRFARNDKIKCLFRSLFGLRVSGLARANPRRLKPAPVKPPTCRFDTCIAAIPLGVVIYSEWKFGIGWCRLQRSKDFSALALAEAGGGTQLRARHLLGLGAGERRRRRRRHRAHLLRQRLVFHEQF